MPDAAAPPAGTAGPTAPTVLAPGNAAPSAAREGDVIRSAPGAAPSADAADLESGTSTGETSAIIRIAQLLRFGPDSSPGTVLISLDQALDADGTLAPRFADLISDCMPVDRATLERAIDKFLDQFEGIAVELTHLGASTNMLSMVSAIACTAVAAEVVIRQRRAGGAWPGALAADDGDGLAALPGLPNSWSWGLDDP
jgi:hypothetical protein